MAREEDIIESIADSLERLADAQEKIALIEEARWLQEKGTGGLRRKVEWATPAINTTAKEIPLTEVK